MRRSPLGRTGILSATTEICLEEGIGQLTMRRLAARLGVTAPAIYRHFRDKDDLIQGLVDEANTSLERFLREALRGSTPRERLQVVTDRYLAFALRQPLHYQVLFLSRGRTDMDVLPRNARSENFRFVVDRIRECMAAGALRRQEPVAVAITLWGLMHGLVALHRQGRFGGGPAAFRPIFRRAVSHLLEGLAA
jgi:AcrR family transcriptional regulator